MNFEEKIKELKEKLKVENLSQEELGKIQHQIITIRLYFLTKQQERIGKIFFGN